MEAWQNRKAHYVHAGRPGDQSREDMMARRILRGLGGSEKLLCRMENIVFGCAYNDEPLWPRTAKLFKTVVQYAWVPARSWSFDASAANGQREVIARFDDLDIVEAENAGTVPVVFAMSTKEGSVYAPWCGDTLPHTVSTAALPFTVLRDLGNGYVLVMQDIVTFVRQFGPYEMFKDD